MAGESRGQGLVRFDIRKYEYQVYSLRTMLGKAVDDVLCLCEYDNNHIFCWYYSRLGFC